MNKPITTSFQIDYIRSDFPVLQQEMNGHQLVYLDSGASAQKPQIVIDAVANFYSSYYCNVHRGVYTLSQQATDALENTRTIVQRHINAAHNEEIIFTAGTTESINLLAKSFGQQFLQEGDEIIISEMAHHANIVPWQLVCEQFGAKLKVIPINDAGELELEVYKKLLSEKTKMVSVAHVSNVLGTVNPVKEMIKAAHNVGAVVHLDGAQAIPHQSVDVQDLGADFYSFSAHKAFGPNGVGILYGKKELLNQLPPYQGGGDMIDIVTFEKTTFNDLPHKFEAGTPNIAGIIGFGEAINYMNTIGVDAINNYEAELTKYATKQLETVEDLTIFGTSEHKAAVFSFAIDGCHPLDIGTLLNEYGIAVRTGHHCCQPLMNRLGVSATTRASLAFYNTKEEIDYLVEKLQQVKQMLQ